MKGKTVRALVLSLAVASTACESRLPAGKAPPAGPKEGDDPAPARPEFEIDYDAHRVVRRNAAGKELWSTTLNGYLGRVRPPHLLADATRVYVTHEDGVTALDAKTGKILWRSKGPNERLFLSRGLLLATGCASDEGVNPDDHWMMARNTATGAEVFRTPLPGKNFDPLPIQEVAGLFVVQSGEAPGGKGQTLLVDRKGKIRHQLDRQVVDGRRSGKDLLLLTSRDVIAVAPDGGTRWTIPFKDRMWIAGGGLVELPGGDLLAFLFGRISDSGVQVVRLDPATGKVVWQTRCAPLGVGHSEYEHNADVKIDEGKVKVTSRGSGGVFVELLDLKSGRRLERTRRDAGRPGE